MYRPTEAPLVGDAEDWASWSAAKMHVPPLRTRKAAETLNAGSLPENVTVGPVLAIVLAEIKTPRCVRRSSGRS